MKRLDVALAADEAYSPHAATLMRSAVVSGAPRSELHIHLLHRGLSRATRARFTRLADDNALGLTLHEIHDSRLDRLVNTSRFPAEIWFRLLLPEVLEGLARVLYLDVDTIVLDDLGPLWETDLEGAHVAAVTNAPYRVEAGAELRAYPDGVVRTYPDGLDIAPSAYFNSGVVLNDLAAWRRDDVTAALLEAAAANTGLAWPDQSVLNLVLGGSRKDLAPRWNATSAILDLGLGADVFEERELTEARERPAVRHFEGIETFKPWHYLCRCRHREDYLRLRRQTPWYPFKPEGRNSANVWRRVRGRARGAIAGVRPRP